VDIGEMPGRGTIASALHWTAEGSRHRNDLELFPFLRPFREMTDATSAALKRPVRTLRALRGTTLRGIAAHALTSTSGFAVLGLQQPESRGEVRLASSNPTDNPAINYNILAEAEDRRRIHEVATVWSRIFETDAMASIGGELTDLKAADLDTPDAFVRWFGSHMLGAAHPSSTCKMGPDTDPMAVVDQHGRVRGVEGLRVADTSIFPTIPSRGTNATAVMAGERIAAFIDEDN
jgi:choline dehydrogenase